MAEPRRGTGTYGRSHASAAAIAKLARRQHDVFDLAQLAECGLSASAVHKRAASGRLYRVHKSVYSLAPAELLTRQGRFMAAALAYGREAVLSHRSAAALHGLRATERAGIDVTVRSTGSCDHEGIEVHRSRTLSDADTAVVDGIPCTTVARTLLDLASVTRQRAVERALDQAEILRVLDAGALAQQLDRNPHHPGARALRAALQQHRAGATPTWNDFEECFLALCRAVQAPLPEVNAWVVPGDGEPAIRPDFVWRGQRLIVETDGHATHRTRSAFELDRRRDQRLTLAGWRVIRVTWRQLTLEPAMIGRLIADLLRMTA